jgi:hypothetical protein
VPQRCVRLPKQLGTPCRVNSIQKGNDMNSACKKVFLTMAVASAAALMCSQTVAQAQTLGEPKPMEATRGKAVDPRTIDAAASIPGQGPTATPAGPTLLNLTTLGNTVAAGNAACPNQPFYLYSGGKPDNFASPPDLAYPSPSLRQFIAAPALTLGYDVPLVNGRFGDSFNLQNTRGVCYAVIEFKTQVSNAGATNDGLTMGHVNTGGAPFDIVAQVINPGTAAHAYAFNATGRSLLSGQTGWGLDRAPAQSVFDLFLQDDTKLDFFRLYVWYGPHCGIHGPNPNSTDC